MSSIAASVPWDQVKENCSAHTENIVLKGNRILSAAINGRNCFVISYEEKTNTNLLSQVSHGDLTVRSATLLEGKMHLKCLQILRGKEGTETFFCRSRTTIYKFSVRENQDDPQKIDIVDFKTYLTKVKHISRIAVINDNEVFILPKYNPLSGKDSIVTKYNLEQKTSTEIVSEPRAVDIAWFDNRLFSLHYERVDPICWPIDLMMCQPLVHSSTIWTTEEDGLDCTSIYKRVYTRFTRNLDDSMLMFRGDHGCGVITPGNDGLHRSCRFLTYIDDEDDHERWEQIRHTGPKNSRNYFSGQYNDKIIMASKEQIGIYDSSFKLIAMVPFHSNKECRLLSAPGVSCFYLLNEESLRACSVVEEPIV